MKNKVDSVAEVVAEKTSPVVGVGRRCSQVRVSTVGSGERGHCYRNEEYAGHHTMHI